VSKEANKQERESMGASEKSISKGRKERLIIGITGASGVILGIRCLEILRQIDEIETHLVISPAAKVTITHETDWKVSEVLSLANVYYNYKDIGAPIASGSYKSMGMIILPCSVKTLSAVANSFAADLMSRAADVTLKEGHPLLLVVRETPLHRGHIRLMDLVSKAGAIIYPPVPAFYTRPESIEDVVQNFVGRILARIGIENDAYLRWVGGISDEQS
jgi:4-hydroxy-3-polyprenylbenzoate decarboxylase